MILCTFPGKFGDLLWALPTLRALSRRIGAPVSLMIAANIANIIPLLRLQPYIGDCWSNGNWITENTAPITPRMPPDTAPDSAYSNTDIYDRIFHLGYRGWPTRPLPFETLDCLNAETMHAGVEGVWLTDEELHLEELWITVPDTYSYRWSWVYGFTDEYFELKFGLIQLLQRKPTLEAYGQLPPVSVGDNPRWITEAGESPTSWIEAATYIKYANVFLGCCSALHVLAVAVGTPAVVMEPSPARHNKIFWPLGTDGPQVYGVKGNDGLLSFDARATRALVQRVLERPR